MSDSTEKRADLAVRWTRAQVNVSAFIRSVVCDPNDVDDLLQDTAYRVAVNFDDYDPERPFVPWAIGIAHNCIRNWRRSRGRDRHLFDDATIRRIADTYGRRESTHDRIRLTLDHCLKTLSPTSRRLLGLRYTENLAPAAIAESLKTTPATVSSTLYRVRESLRRCIESSQSGDREATP